MKLKTSTARAALATAFLLTASVFQPSAAWAQADMKDMPGMAPAATPAPKEATPAATPEPAAAAMSQQQMNAMPGMIPAKPAASKSKDPAPARNNMAGMPGMAAPGAAKTDGMADMPGMTTGAASEKGMAGMTGMPADDSTAPARMSAPGITILRPPQKWVPPRGDNRAAKLLSRPALDELMKPLPPPVEDSKLHSFSLFELLEYRFNSAGPDTFVWDFVGWYGGDYNRLWIKTEGRQDLSAGSNGEGDLQLLYGRIIAPFWDFQIGLRGKSNLGSGLRDNSRTYAVIGVQGLAPGVFEVEPAIYISDRGEVSAELTMSADLYLTQRLVLQPRFSGEVSVQGDDRFGTGSGVTETDIGLRLRYDIRREIGPYIGISWLRNYGETARIAREEGEAQDTFSFVAGLRLWF